MSKIYALLVGINKYHPDSGVSNLVGCVNDINAMEDFLKNKFVADAHTSIDIKKLINEEATRENIIKGFQKIITQVYPKDTFLFYYAGHGSHTKTNDVFKEYDAKEQDETFVCYDSRLPGKYDLADKEIAVLLSRIREDVHKIVIADSCFSGSITRGGKVRYYKGNDKVRSIDSYLLEGDDYYKELLEKKGKISIPRSPHLLLSGCNRDEYAQETDDARGLFSSKLIEVLERTQDISYTHLFEEVKELVAEASYDDQHPTIDAWKGFNPNNAFLRADTKPNSKYLIQYKNNNWNLDFGAIYGLPTLEEKIKRIQLDIFDGVGSDAKLITKGLIQKVNLADTWLEDSSLKNLDTAKKYWGEFKNLATAITIGLNGPDELIEKFQTNYNKDKSAYVRLRKNANAGRYVLELAGSEDKIVATIFLKKMNKIVAETKGSLNTEFVRNIKLNLEHIAKWESTANLKNSSNQDISDDIELIFSIEPHNSRKEIQFEQNNILLDYPLEYQKDEPIWYNIKARNNSNEPVFISLLHLSEDYEVQSHCQNQLLGNEDKWLTLDNDHGLVISDKNRSSITDIYKVIVSNKEFDEHKFLQKKIEKKSVTRSLQDSKSRSVVERENYMKNLPVEEKEKWGVKTISVTIVRRNNDSISSDQQLSKKIKIKDAGGLTANLSLTALANKGRVIAPWSSISKYVNQSNSSVINVGSAGRAIQDQSVFELSDIDNATNISDKSLVLNLSEKLNKKERIIPVTSIGEFIIPVGYAQLLEDGTIDITIDNLQSYEDTYRKTKNRSIKRAAWFCLLKLVGKEDSIFKLRKVNFKENGEIERMGGGLVKEETAIAKRILVVTHGIIGDTKTILKNLEFVLDQKYYDIVLSFDYENLNTPIEEIAGKFKEELENAGIGLNHGKQVDVMAHSMGGLISRYLIEQLYAGHSFINTLYMFGTPNGGSVFGKIPEFRDKLVQLLTIGLNYGSPWLGKVAIILELLNQGLDASKHITKTLEQMSLNSPLLKKLSTGDRGNTKYHVIAGDITDYKDKFDGSPLKDIIEKVLVKLGDAANSNTPNDIAVTVKDISAVNNLPEAQVHTICCHHMNYFDEGESLRIFRDLLKDQQSA